MRTQFTTTQYALLFWIFLFLVVNHDFRNFSLYLPSFWKWKINRYEKKSKQTRISSVCVRTIFLKVSCFFLRVHFFIPYVNFVLLMRDENYVQISKTSVGSKWFFVRSLCIPEIQIRRCESENQLWSACRGEESAFHTFFGKNCENSQEMVKIQKQKIYRNSKKFGFVFIPPCSLGQNSNVQKKNSQKLCEQINTLIHFYKVTNVHFTAMVIEI